jgi:hypothetical protein
VTDALIQSMSSLLVASGCDLGDEREVLRTLAAAKYRDGDIVALSDAAIEHARVHRQSPSIAGSIASLVALVLFVSTTVIWSAIFCGA